MESKNLEMLTGIVEKIIYQSSETGYTVLSLCNKSEEVTAVGNMYNVKEGEELELSGYFTVHSTYGPQFKVRAYAKVLPSGAVAILKYLSSGTLYGIGPATAKKLVKSFGDETLEVMENQPETVAKIKGITYKRALEISNELKSRKSTREIITKLAPFGITPEEAVDIYKVYGADSTEKFINNPYLLCGSEIGFNFLRIDEIAQTLNISEDNENRLCTGVLFVLTHNLLNGHTCLPRKKLLEVAAQMLSSNVRKIDDICELLLSNLSVKSKIINNIEFIFLTEYYLTEQSIAEKIDILKRYSEKLPPLKKEEIQNIQSNMKIELEELQLKAVETSLNEAVLVLTGGPGTGKTTTLNAVISVMKNRNLKIALAAPTGRAAKRMTELTGMEAKTIHRLLEVEWDEKNQKHIFTKNERNPLNCDVIIIDELSMVDVTVFETLLRSLRLGCRVILVGDINQLSSVGAGNILHDLIDSGCLSCVCLEKVFRQALKSLIISNAHDIVNGITPDLTRKDADFFMIERGNPYITSETVVDLFVNRLPAAYGFSAIDSIQVLCPSKKMQAGTVNLNNMLQEKLNPKSEQKREVVFRGVTLREGDKVMQIKNNYDILWETETGEYGCGVFNGDIGILESIDNVSRTVTVKFDNKIATYTGEDISQLELAYAVTVHKSQGSEFDCVIIPLIDTPYRLRYRNLLYTAVTRAKKLLVIVGSQSVVNKMVENNKKTLRYTGLKCFLKEVSNEL